MENSKFLFVLNPKSGKRNTDVKTMIQNFLDKYNQEGKIIVLDKELNLDAEIENFNPDSVIAVGGDGTVNFVSASILKSDIKLGILPAGSANGLANSLGIPNNLEKALEKLAQAKTELLDVIRINDSHNCLHLSDAGINARIVKRAEMEKTKGISGYALQFFKEAFKNNKSVFSFELNAGDLHKKYKAEVLVIANTKQYGTGAEINPTGKYNDGRFEVIILKPYPWHYFFRLALAMFTRQTHLLPLVKTYSLKSANITFHEPQDIQVDGEVINNVEELKIEIIPGALKILMNK